MRPGRLAREVREVGFLRKQATERLCRKVPSAISRQFAHLGADRGPSSASSPRSPRPCGRRLRGRFLKIRLHDFARVSRGRIPIFAASRQRPKTQPACLAAASALNCQSQHHGEICSNAFSRSSNVDIARASIGQNFVPFYMPDCGLASQGLVVRAGLRRVFGNLAYRPGFVRRHSATRVHLGFFPSSLPWPPQEDLRKAKPKSFLRQGPEPGQRLCSNFKDDATAFNAESRREIEGKGVLTTA